MDEKMTEGKRDFEESFEERVARQKLEDIAEVDNPADDEYIKNGSTTLFDRIKGTVNQMQSRQADRLEEKAKKKLEKDAAKKMDKVKKGKNPLTSFSSITKKVLKTLAKGFIVIVTAPIRIPAYAIGITIGVAKGVVEGAKRSGTKAEKLKSINEKASKENIIEANLDNEEDEKNKGIADERENKMKDIESKKLETLAPEDMIDQLKPSTPEEVAESFSARNVVERIMKESIKNNTINDIELDDGKVLRFEPILFSDKEAIEADIKWDCNITLINKENNENTQLYARLSKDEEMYSEDHKFEGSIELAAECYDHYFPLEQVYDLEEALSMEAEEPAKIVLEAAKESDKNKTLDQVIAEAEIQKNLENKEMDEIDIHSINLDGVELR